MSRFTFCPLCGLNLVGNYQIGLSYPRCPTGHYTYYANQSVGAAAIIHDQGLILLERRATESGYGLWALPGGMAEQGETIEQCVTREVREETGLDVEVIRLLDVKSGNKACIVFYETRPVGGQLQKSAESIELKWFPFNQLPLDQFAFSKQKEMLLIWIRAQNLDAV